MNTDSQFFFGGTSRPVMIKLAPDFTLFSAMFCDCTGLQLMHDDLDAHAGLNLRTPHEVWGLTSWLLFLTPPTLAEGECEQVSKTYPNFSPEFEEESIAKSEDFEGYDATELNVSAVWRNDKDDGLCLHLAANEPDGLDVQGIPVELLPALCQALDVFRTEWETTGIDLTLDQPLAHIEAP